MRKFHPSGFRVAGLFLLAAVVFGGCSSDDPATTTSSTAPDCSASTTPVAGVFTSDVPAWIQDNFFCIEASVSGDNIVINFRDLPPYTSYYYGSGHALYDATEPEKLIPNSISEQNITLTVPSSPAIATSSSETPPDTIGVTIHGVAIFDNAANPPDVLADEVATMDINGAHPTPDSVYHHHTEPVNITDNDSALVGIALDGFPIYGKLDEDSTTAVFTGEVDNWHEHTTTLFSTGSGVPHYHIVSDNILTDSDGTDREVSYSLGANFGGTPGTSQ